MKVHLFDPRIGQAGGRRGGKLTPHLTLAELALADIRFLNNLVPREKASLVLPALDLALRGSITRNRGENSSAQHIALVVKGLTGGLDPMRF